jgi:Tfp pilus assembly protein PilZ
MIKVASSESRGESILTHTENIGVGGVRVTVRNELKLFTAVEMEIDLMDINEHIKVKGKVAWNVRRKSIEKVKPMFYDTGIEFTDITKRDQDRLRTILQLALDKGAPISKPYL